MSTLTICKAMSGGPCHFCDTNLSHWLTMIDAEQPEATGGSPDKAGVYMYAMDEGSRRSVLFVGRSNSSVRANVLDDMGGRETKMRQFIQDHITAIRVRFAVNDDESGCSESDMICQHWKTADQMPRFNHQWPNQQGGNDCT